MKHNYSEDDVKKLVDNETTHPYYLISLERAREMNTWYESEFEEYSAVKGELFQRKNKVIKQSNIESNKDYQDKLDRMRLFPLEAKFLSSQKRIYDENNVNRQYPEADYWKELEGCYDDQGSTITEFYRDKVLFVKEVLGFGAVVTDLMIDENGNALNDEDGKPKTYNYVVRPHELINFDIHQGKLTMLMIKQSFHDMDGKLMHKWTTFTNERIYVHKQTQGLKTKEPVNDVPNPFGEVPATVIKGDVDSVSSFRVGKPRRYSLKGLYLAASELFYDLQKGSELFGHPIPVMSEAIVKSMAGVEDDDSFDLNTVKEEVGMVVVYPNESDPPNKLFYQADMQGLQHLRDVIFKDLMSLIFNLAQVRDKSVVKSNVSGDAKFLDNVEEQGLLAQTAMDMEDIENAVATRMAKVRGEDVDDVMVTYSKHYDLSSAGEIWSDITEGLQYKGMNLSTMKYLLKEYLRKRSAPQETIDEIMGELEEFGMPKQASDLRDLAGIIPPEELSRMAQPHRDDPVIPEPSTQATDQSNDQDPDQEETEDISIDSGEQ